MTFPIRLSSFLLALASAAALAGALTAQYGLGWNPCELCLMQRVPIILAGSVALLSLLPAHPDSVRSGMIRCAGWVFVGTSLLAFYHYGVEQHWWLYEGGCSADKNAPKGPIDFALALSQPVVVRCDQPPWIWHGITLAGLNVIYSAVVGTVALVLERNDR